MRLSELGLAEPGADREVAGLASDSRAVRPGDLFFAIKGARYDGHAFVEEAFRRGAVAAVVEREVASSGRLIRVADARRALAQAARRFYGRPDCRLRLLGVTGSIGKTTIALLARNLLCAAGRRSGLIGSLGIDSGGGLKPSGFTTPEALVIQRELAAMVAAGATHAVMEVSSHALALHRVWGARFAGGVLTELVPHEHLDFHGSFSNYLAVKRSFLDLIVPGGTIVYWADDPHALSLVQDAGHLVPIGVGFERGAIRVTELSLSTQRSAFALVAGAPAAAGFPLRMELSTRLLGRAHVKNIALAVALALSEGVEPAAVQAVVEAQPPVRRRMEGYTLGELAVIDDTVGNPQAIQNCFEVVSAAGAERPVVIYAVRGRRGEQINRENGEALGRCLSALGWRSLIVTASRDVADAANQPTEGEVEAVMAGLRSAGAPAVLVPELEGALKAALGRRPDLLLLLGAQGMDAGLPLLERLCTRDAVHWHERPAMGRASL
ncbi:MAG TPA: Mur ligase family protein [Limnochordia bacterium]